LVLKRIRRGAYEKGGYLVVRQLWLGERWDGPKHDFGRWAVYRRGSPIEARLLLGTFKRLSAACRFINDEEARGTATRRV
jgi:hypothetical protein